MSEAVEKANTSKKEKCSKKSERMKTQVICHNLPKQLGDEFLQFSSLVQQKEGRKGKTVVSNTKAGKVTKKFTKR